ncbi:hypothetical protein ADIS_4834 [Lunatimonas lonarensis]|uniref:DUF4407 domain-containing protein n=1 Tax=Lunatimonas lonarensis TaxID=1232681 RepID=R7ZKV1_9BACT|nr:DUF4407 domain-containing protein [Lunatimonas lonarensis]EON74723.1 hypothetical protein ADIS_4834 [Lunatimonas lonarensis]
MNKLSHFLWFCAGTYRPLLKRCPTEANKYVGIGGTVLFTAIFAGLAAGYALHTVFDDLVVTILLALVWATAIFNLDRYIVGTMRKNGKPWTEFKLAAPRLVLAIVLALVIAKPLELRIFEKEINQQLATQKLELVKQTKSALEANYPEIAALDLQIGALQEEIAASRQFRNEKQGEYDAERFGVKTPGTSGRAGIGVNARKKEEQLDQAQKAYEETERLNRMKIDQLEVEKTRLNQLKEAALLDQESTISEMDGIAARLQALADLSQAQSAISLANSFIILLFILLETAPILVKWMTPRGPYDTLLAFRENALMLHTEEQWYQTQAKTTASREICDFQLANRTTRLKTPETSSSDLI